MRPVRRFYEPLGLSVLDFPDFIAMRDEVCAKRHGMTFFRCGNRVCCHRHRKEAHMSHKHPASTHHHAAAEHYEKAAHHHRLAARLYEDDESGMAAHHAQSAAGYSAQAAHHSAEASKLHAHHHGEEELADNRDED